MKKLKTYPETWDEVEPTEPVSPRVIQNEDLECRRYSLSDPWDVTPSHALAVLEALEAAGVLVEIEKQDGNLMAWCWY